MLFRKPYAFIIKHFRLFHLAMLACLIFLLISLNDINDLFATLQKTNTLMYTGANVYINNIVYFIILLVLVLTGTLFWLLREKKKPTRLYLLLIVYMFVLIPIYIYLYSTLNTMIENLITSDTIIFGRDISMMASLPAYIFIAICFIRGIGFNLKQFNFSKDLKDLQIDEKDSEEIELMLRRNNYKYLRLLRRSIREIKYYILENKFAIIVITGLALLVLAGFGINYYNEYMKTLAASEATNVNGITYTVRSSYVTEEDSTGKVVSDKYKYVVIDMSFHNATTSNKAVDIDLITLANGRLSYQPTLTRNSKFYDLGTSYNRGDVLEPGETRNATLTFEIPKKVIVRNLKLRVRYALENKSKKVISRYRLFDINPKNIDTQDNAINVKLGELMNINPVGNNRFDLTIKGYSLQDVYDNKYVLCSTIDKCTPLSEVITPEKKDAYTMLVIDFSATLYDNNRFYETLNTYNKIFENYLTINYRIMNREYTSNAKVVTKSNVDNKLFIIVDRKITRADSIDLKFNFRNDEYNISLLEY